MVRLAVQTQGGIYASPTTTIKPSMEALRGRCENEEVDEEELSDLGDGRGHGVSGVILGDRLYGNSHTHEKQQSTVQDKQSHFL